MIVMKFGGTSVGSAERIVAVAALIKAERDRHPVVVVSAVEKITNKLIALANSLDKGLSHQILREIIDTHEKILSQLVLNLHLLDEEWTELQGLVVSKKNLTKEMLDHFASFGERCSAKIVAAYLNSIGVKAEAFPAWEIGMITDDHYGKAEPLDTSYALMCIKIRALTVVPVITGFIGKNAQGKITTLGRGGSDYTASIIGRAIHAAAIQIWTDVDGIMTINPKNVKKAMTIDELSFEEASELAYFGLKVVHPKTILPAMKDKIPVQVLNTFHPENKGTTIWSDVSQIDSNSNKISGITYKSGVIVICIKSPEFFDGNEILSEIFHLFAKYDTMIDVILTSIASVSLLTNDEENLHKLIPKLEKFGTVEISRGNSIVCVIGGRNNTADYVGKIFSTLSKHHVAVEMISQASAGLSLTFIVSDQDANQALEIIHEECFRKKTIQGG